MNGRKTIAQLYEGFLANDLSADELDRFLQMIKDPINEEDVNGLMGKSWQDMFEDSDKVSKPPVIRMWRRVAVAAAVILAIATGGYLLVFKKTAKTEIAKTQQQRFNNDVDPGNFKAKLTLADGRTIILDSAAEGEIVKQGNATVVNQNGQLVYSPYSVPDSARRSPLSGLIFNTLATAYGETYTTVLADGSKVWLNSASSIKFPVAFTGKERRVEITGEAYFQVRHNDKMPFRVIVNGVQIEDLGTEFNVNAYSDEGATKTTLIEGSVKVGPEPGEGPARGTIIKPGQQAIVTKNGQLTTNTPGNLNKIIAWKNGMFQFENDNLDDVMRQLSRWYNITVVNNSGLKENFTGEIPRTAKLTTILKAIELTSNTKFVIEGRNITITR
ncbi:MAG TPA: FecR domain-containing protein [Chitinophagaceae bacterium]|nr:FecR domain-containing protein [Chitinophagaceae bacterium]